ncbi:MAG: DUF58 domain-containing protein [Deltaproteobacteria bacterium]|nr:DUF58 domain-containing protein [Deltaproteobacteria bacterium]
MTKGTSGTEASSARPPLRLRLGLALRPWRGLERRLSSARFSTWAGTARDLFPLTPLGLFVACASLGSYALFAVPHLDYVLQVVSAIGFGLVAVMMVSTILGAWLTARTLQKSPAGSSEPISFEARRGFGRGLRVRRLRWMPALEVSWRWMNPSGVAVHLEVAEDRRFLNGRVEALGRAYGDRIERRLVVEDSFGLTRICFRHWEARSVEIFPWSGALRGGVFLRTLIAGDEVAHPAGSLAGERVDLRRYAVGDPLRLVLWKVYARSGQLVVRTAERTVAPRVRVLGYLVAAPGDEPAAAAAQVAIESGRMGESWVFGADGEPGGSTTVPEARRRVIRSVAARNTGDGSAAGLRAFVDGQQGPEPSRLVVFAPAMAGAWTLAVKEVARRVPTLVLLATDGLLEPSSKELSRWAKAKAKVTHWLKTPEALEGGQRQSHDQTQSHDQSRSQGRGGIAGAAREPTENDAAAIGALARQLAASGVEVQCVDRTSGRELDLGRTWNANVVSAPSASARVDVARRAV